MTNEPKVCECCGQDDAVEGGSECEYCSVVPDPAAVAEYVAWCEWWSKMSTVERESWWVAKLAEYGLPRKK